MKNMSCKGCLHYKICEQFGVFDSDVGGNIEYKSCDDYISLSIHQTAVGKMIPKRPRGYFDSCPHYRCPSCGRSVKLYNDSEELPCCTYCGQRLDWSNDDELESKGTEV